MSRPTLEVNAPNRSWTLAGAVGSQRRFVYLMVALLCAGGIWAGFVVAGTANQMPGSK